MKRNLMRDALAEIAEDAADDAAERHWVDTGLARKWDDPWWPANQELIPVRWRAE